MVFVTTDPARDDEQVLRDYLDRFDPSFIGLTGDLDTIVDGRRGRSRVGIDDGEKLPRRLRLDGTDHSASTATTRPRSTGAQETSAAEFAADIHSLLGRRDDP